MNRYNFRVMKFLKAFIIFLVIAWLLFLLAVGINFMIDFFIA